jgi:cytochrome P450
MTGCRACGRPCAASGGSGHLVVPCQTGHNRLMRQEPDVPAFPFEFGPFGTSTRTYDLLRRSSPVCQVSLPSGLKAWLVTRYADVCKVHKDPIFSRAEAVRVGATLITPPAMELEPDVLQNTDGEQHSRLRRVFGFHYSQEHVPRWTSAVLEEAHRAMDLLPKGRTFDLRADLFEPVASRSAETLFGFTSEAHLPLDLFFDPVLLAQARSFIYSGVSATRSLKYSYADALNTAKEGGQISEQELIINLVVFRTATFAAVRAAFLGGVFALLRNRNQWEACLHDRSLVPGAIEEMLRCFPNGDGQFLRVAKDDCELSSARILRGESVLAPVSAANVDPEVFAKPRSFNICRINSSRHIAFGIGRHRCIGATLAVVWMQTVLSALLDRVPTLRLSTNRNDISFGSNPLIYLIEKLPVQI